MKVHNSLIICYKPPISNKILKIMKENSLFDEKKLLENIEKVIPVSKIFKYKKYKNIKNVSFLEKNGIILFYIYT